MKTNVTKAAKKSVIGIKKESIKRKEKKYKPEDVIAALSAIEKDGLSYRKAAAQFNVPAPTLAAKKNFIYPIEAKKGPSTVLTSQEEGRIVSWIIECGNKGVPVTKTSLLDSVKYLLDISNRKTLFTNNRPGRKWYKAFMKRHKELSVRTAQTLPNSRASVTEENIRIWFQTVKTYLASKGLLNIEPSRFFNLDESAFFLCPKPDRVIVKRGSKSVYSVVDGDDKESITVLYTGSAAGAMPPPMVLFWYKRKIPDLIKKRMPGGWSLGTTENG